MTNVSPSGESDPLPVSLRITALSDGSFEWRTVYNNDPDGGLRDYRLVPDGADTTRFVLDERNGIRLTARLIGNVLVAPFEVGGRFLVSRYTLLGDDRMEHEIVFWPTGASLTTTGQGLAGEQGQPVTSYEVGGFQRTHLKRRGT